MLLDSITGQIKDTLTSPYNYYYTKYVKMSYDDRFLAVSNDNSINIFEISEKQGQEIPNLEGSVQIFEFS